MTSRKKYSLIIGLALLLMTLAGFDSDASARHRRRHFGFFGGCGNCCGIGGGFGTNVGFGGFGGWGTNVGFGGYGGGYGFGGSCSTCPTPVILQPVASCPAPCPVVSCPAPCPVVSCPAPCPVVSCPAPAPVISCPAPTPVVFGWRPSC